MKIYTDDPLVSYRETRISPDRTKLEIDAKLREYGVFDIHWHWKPAANDIYVQFGIEETIEGTPVKVMAKINCPTIWDKANKRSNKSEYRVDRVNLKVSMRAMWWYIKTHLETAYAMQSSWVAGFLADMVTTGGNRFFDTLKKNLDKYAAVAYTPEPNMLSDEQIVEGEIIGET